MISSDNLNSFRMPKPNQFLSPTVSGFLRSRREKAKSKKSNKKKKDGETNSTKEETKSDV